METHGNPEFADVALVFERGLRNSVFRLSGILVRRVGDLRRALVGIAAGRKQRWRVVHRS